MMRDPITELAINSSDFMQRYGLRSASSVQRAIKPLLERDIIDRENGDYIVTDRFFGLWIQKRQST